MEGLSKYITIALAGIAVYILVQQVGFINPIITTAPSNWEYVDAKKR